MLTAISFALALASSLLASYCYSAGRPRLLAIPRLIFILVGIAFLVASQFV